MLARRFSSRAEIDRPKGQASGGRNTDNIYLLGFMASGKTSVGRALARRLGRRFLDTDDLIERRSRRGIRRIMAEDGEEAFRRIEEAAVAAAAREGGTVVAVGGGAALRPSNVRVLRKSGTVVFLEAPLSVLARRAAKAGLRSRPLWDRVGPLFKRRAPLYKKAAHVSVEAGMGTPEEIAGLIASRLGLNGPRLRRAALRPPRATPIRRVTVRLMGGSYPVWIGLDWLNSLPAKLKACVSGKRCVLVTDQRLASGIGRKVKGALRRGGWEVASTALPSGERAKSFTAIQRLYGFLLASGVERRTPLIAVGGGSVGDAAGFAAATFQRGIPLVHVPTTLLAQVDSSVGGKTAVNHPMAKNAVGAFHQPILVAADVGLARSLPERDYLSGLAEVVKMALVFDRSFARRLLERWKLILSRDPGTLAWAVRRCVELKAKVVAVDERDLGGRRELLNFGHTVGHALEASTRYARFRHGEAVAWGMAAAIRLSRDRDWLRRPGDLGLALALLAGLKTPPWPLDLEWSRFAACLGRDKKVRDAGNVVVLLRNIGEPSRVRDVGFREIRAALAGLSREGRS
ncbi:MAG: 3-dehydroquinate synthase [Elusimicrobia bacterium]|nr:3-dehydroquinate synthase [Elusimicrobiota bacterium]